MIDRVKVKLYADKINRMSGVERKMILDIIRLEVEKEIGFNYSDKTQFVEAIFDNSLLSKLINSVMDLSSSNCPVKLSNDEKWVAAYLVNSP